MNEGVQIILERMKTHPDEFDGVGAIHNSQYTLGGSKWGTVISRYWEFITEEEHAALKAGITEANRQNLTSAVLRTLTNTPERARNAVRARLVESQLMNNSPTMVRTQGFGAIDEVKLKNNIANNIVGTAIRGKNG